MVQYCSVLILLVVTHLIAGREFSKNICKIDSYLVFYEQNSNLFVSKFLADIYLSKWLEWMCFGQQWVSHISLKKKSW